MNPNTGWTATDLCLSRYAISPNQANLFNPQVFDEVPAASHNLSSLENVPTSLASAELGHSRSQSQSVPEGLFDQSTPSYRFPPHYNKPHINQPLHHPQPNHLSQSSPNAYSPFPDSTSYTSAASHQNFSTFTSVSGLDASSNSQYQWEPEIRGSHPDDGPYSFSSGEYRPVADYSTMSYEERHQISPEILARFARKGYISSQSSVSTQATGPATQLASSPDNPVQHAPPRMEPRRHSDILARPTAPFPHMHPHALMYQSPVEGRHHSMPAQSTSVPIRPASSAVPLLAPFKKPGACGENRTKQVVFVSPPTIPEESNYHTSPASLTPITSYFTNTVARAPSSAYKNGQRLRFSGTIEGLSSMRNRLSSITEPARHLTPDQSLPVACPVPSAKSSAPKQSSLASENGGHQRPSLIQPSPHQNDREKQAFSLLIDVAPPTPALRMAPSLPSRSSSSALTQPLSVHQTANTDMEASLPEAKETLPSAGGEEGAAKSPALACQYCRKRKACIACGLGPPIPENIEVPSGPRTCNQCHSRGIICRFPEASRRGLRHGKPSRRVIYGPENQCRIVDPEILTDFDLQWEDVIYHCDQLRTSGGRKPRDKNVPRQRTREWSPTNFVPAVDTDILRELASKGLIPPGGYL